MASPPAPPSGLGDAAELLLVKDPQLNACVKLAAETVQRLAGVQLGPAQYPMIEARMRRRLGQLGLQRASAYLAYFQANEASEQTALVSLLTTHHTFFFREFVHFEKLESEHLPRVLRKKHDSARTLQVWSAACSRGHEAYSMAMFFNRLKGSPLLPQFDFDITGTDIDPESVKIAQNGVYLSKEVDQIPLSFLQGNWMRGTGDIQHFMKVKQNLKQKVHFEVANLLSLPVSWNTKKFDVIFCRNVLIYFNQDQVKQVVQQLLNHLNPDGVLVLGLSESIQGYGLPVESHSATMYTHPLAVDQAPAIKPLAQTKPLGRVKVFAVDDSPTILSLIAKILSSDHDFELIGSAKSAAEAREKLTHLRPDVVTLDIHMPGETGIDYLQKDMKPGHPPVVILSSLDRDGTDIAQKALSLGALDYIEKPSLQNLDAASDEIRLKLKLLAKYKGAA